MIPIHTIKITEEITVTTPIEGADEGHLMSWGFLWGGYLLAAIACTYQVLLDRKTARITADIEQGTGEASSGDTTRALVSTTLTRRCTESINRVKVIIIFIYIYIHCVVSLSFHCFVFSSHISSTDFSSLHYYHESP